MKNFICIGRVISEDLLYNMATIINNERLDLKIAKQVNLKFSPHEHKSVK
jgi:hypothetical protein